MDSSLTIVSIRSWGPYLGRGINLSSFDPKLVNSANMFLTVNASRKRRWIVRLGGQLTQQMLPPKQIMIGSTPGEVVWKSNLAIGSGDSRWPSTPSPTLSLAIGDTLRPGLLFRYSATRLNAQEERLVTSS